MPIAFPPIAQHGVIGDRRTGALVAADGTIDWFCAPDFDNAPVFGSVLDPERGGYCRLGPRAATLGRQGYVDDTMTLVTDWPNGRVELSDVMAWPGGEAHEMVRGQRIILRRLRITGDAELGFELRPRRDFSEWPRAAHPAANGAIFTFADGMVGVWTSFPLTVEKSRAFAHFESRAGDEHWVVIGWNALPEEWSVARARQVFHDAESYWREWCGRLKLPKNRDRAPAMRRAALTVQVLSSAHHDSPIAALTTSLPERIRGDRNYDYRFAWVRDASLTLALLARLGRTEEVRRYLAWLSELPSLTESPLQVCYRLDGNPHLEEEKISGLSGYAFSVPVHRGNRAAKQSQLGSLGFFADCARIYVDLGGEWRDEFWHLLKRAAQYICTHWQEADSGVWELTKEAHYVASRVMCWVVLQRAVHIAQRTGHMRETDRWNDVAGLIHAEVMERGWCEEKNSFRQRYDSDALDAAALLIPLMDFLPIDHPRVTGTIAALERELVVNGLLHRFDPSETLGGTQLPLGEFEGAFLPCVFWHAHVLAKADRCDEAEAILERIEAIAGDTGLFAEEVDAAKGIFLGNTPLLFAHVEYVRAIIELNEARARLAQAAIPSVP